MKTILVATDLSARSDRAVIRAAHLARETGATLHIVHIVDDELPGALLQARTEEAEAVLAAMIAEQPALSDLKPIVDVETGHLDRMLPKLVREREVDLVVVGTHRSRGLAEAFGAPALSRILRGLNVPMLVAVGRPEAPYEDVAVGWDFSPAGEAAALAARQLVPDANITLVHAWDEPVTAMPYGFEAGGMIAPETLDRMKTDIARAAVKLPKQGDAGWLVDIAIGPAPFVLRKRADDGACDLLAVGSHARSGLARLLLGATAENVALSASCDVLITPPIAG